MQGFALDQANLFVVRVQDVSVGDELSSPGVFLLPYGLSGKDDHLVACAADDLHSPIAVEILEPMRDVRVVLEPNETGISCDLRFRARTACVEEGRQIARRAGRVYMDATRFAQYGRWQGEVRYDGKTLPIDASRVYDATPR